VEDEGWRIRKSGERFWANTIITPVRTADGEVCGFAKVTRDLTVRRAGEERLRRSEEMFRLLVDSVKDYAIFMLDPSGRVISWNAGAERIKGYTADEVIGRDFSLFYTPEDLAIDKPARILAAARQGRRVEEEGWRVRKDGTRFWADVIVTVIHDEQGALRGYAKVTRDITERKRAEETQHALEVQREARLQAEEERRRAEASYRVAQEASRAKDEFLMTLSHELRTPLTAILGWSRLLPTIQPDDPMFREAVQSISRSAQLQSRLIDDVLDVSRIVSGKLRLMRETVDVAQIIAASVEGIRPSADAKQISIAMTLAPALGSIVVDATRLHQVMWNMLANAVKFTPKGGEIRVAARRTSSQAQIAVSDTGQGIDPNFLPHVFEPFRQAESASTRVHGGLGLGLSIVRYIVEAHGGSVAAESGGRGKGTTITVTLPVAAIEAPPEKDTPPESPRRGIDPTALANVSMLIVDDDVEGREIVHTVLTRAGARVALAEAAPDALSQLEKLRPDIIITDIAMPEINGYEFARTVRNRDDWRSIRVVAFSAFPERLSPERDLFDAYIAKPVDPFELVDTLAEIVARPR
jgi:PAS domain S-box-containing protein